MRLKEHKPQGDPCATCGAPASHHRKPRVRARAYHLPTPEGAATCLCGKPAASHVSPRTVKKRKRRDAKRPNRRSGATEFRRIIGVDGEGHDTADGRHIYTYLCAADEFGECVAEAYNPEGLTHDECAEMILSLPRNSLRFGFMFSYDVTKIIEELPPISRYTLLRPDARAAHRCRACGQKWEFRSVKCPSVSCGSTDIQTFTKSLRYKGRKYGFFNGSFSIAARKQSARPDQPWRRQKPARAASVKIWDCFRFFGCAFVEALKDWKIGTPEQIAEIALMKGKRGAFDVEDPEDVKRYCKLECHLLAQMMRKVIDSHDKAAIPLTSYYGAGSTAGALLKKNAVADFKGPTLSQMKPELAHAIRCAFFGGRFENSTIGTIQAPIHSYDISSAYPYALSNLPCLTCGRWRHVTRPTLRQIETAKLALCKYTVAPVSDRARERLAWCPLPFRDEKGSICYGTGFSGWAWKEEFLSAVAGWDFVKLDREAWIYDARCHHKPFAFLPQVYRKRVEWGKEGAGKVLKLGANASYGKTAQAIGDDPPFQSWVWAGNTTAGTRGQLNRAISKASDPWSVLAVATDGIYATESLKLDTPRDTKTDEWARRPRVDETGKETTRKPLGGWEHKEIPEGAFLAKPGLYFRLSAKLSEIRARGVGRREVHEQRDALIASFEAWDRKSFDHNVKMTSRRFFGAKNSITVYSGCLTCNTHWPGLPTRCCPTCGALGNRSATTLQKLPDGREAYGTWDLRVSEVRFDPRPKREAVTKGGTFGRLRVRDLNGRASAPYATGETTPEGLNARASQDFALEQPDWEESRLTA